MIHHLNAPSMPQQQPMIIQIPQTQQNLIMSQLSGGTSDINRQLSRGI